MLVSTHVYYSYRWAPLKASYLMLEKLLRDFLWAYSPTHSGFHRVVWEFCCLPRESGDIGLLSTQKQGISLCTKWVIQAISSSDTWKVFLKHCISSGYPVNKITWKGIGFQTLLVMKDIVCIEGTFVSQSIWCA